MTRNRGAAPAQWQAATSIHDLIQSALAFIPKILDRLFQPLRVDRLMRLFTGFDRLGRLSCPTLFWVPLRFRFVNLIQVYAPPPRQRRYSRGLGGQAGPPESRLKSELC
jgi:hypothetical protein